MHALDMYTNYISTKSTKLCDEQKRIKNRCVIAEMLISYTNSWVNAHQLIINGTCTTEKPHHKKEDCAKRERKFVDC